MFSLHLHSPAPFSISILYIRSRSQKSLLISLRYLIHHLITVPYPSSHYDTLSTVDTIMSTQTTVSTLDLAVDLTPPSKRPELALSPNSFLQMSSTQEYLKRKMLLADEENNYDVDPKRARLDPEPSIEDTTIEKYHVRTHGLLPQDRQQLRVSVPYETSWLKIKGQLGVCIASSLLYVWR